MSGKTLVPIDTEEPQLQLPSPLESLLSSSKFGACVSVLRKTR